MNYATIINNIIASEGGYTNNPADRGGPTNYGITLATARANGYIGDMKNLSLAFAERIYLRKFIFDPGFDSIAKIYEPLAIEMIDTGVNMGVSVPSKFLQRLLNVFNQRSRKYGDLDVDGDVGSVTLLALTKFVAYRGTEGLMVLTEAMNSMQAERYVEIAEKNETQEDFVYGWLKNRT